MKIEKLILRNFSAIKNAMNSNEITIDFSNMKNKICILIGPNGCGKTSVLSMLHPFADLGNLDVRNNNSYILENKEGYKEITIIKQKDVYVIKHIYSPHKGKSHSTKSYISKNGVELNTNGNVSSFKEYVKEELHIEPEYLKLIRLGDNVTNLIKLSATERKNFMSKILEDIGVYLEYYKNINNKLRQISDIISHDENKLNSLNVIDLSIEKKELEKDKKNKKKLDASFISISNKIAIQEDIIKELGDISEIRDSLYKLRNKVQKMDKISDSKSNYKDISYYKSNITKLEKDNVRIVTEIDLRHTILRDSLNQLNEFEELKHSYEIRAEKDRTIADEIKRMETNLEVSKKKLKVYKKSIDGLNEYIITLDEMNTLINRLDRIEDILTTTYSVGNHVVEKVVSLMEENRNVQAYIDSCLIDYHKQQSNNSSLFMQTIIKLISSKKDDDIIMNCDKECVAKDLFIRLQHALEDPNMDIVNKQDELFYQDMNLANVNITHALHELSDIKELLEKLPDKVCEKFSKEAIFKKIKKLDMIYDKKEFNKILSNLRDIENYYKELQEYNDSKNHLDKFKTTYTISDNEKEFNSLLKKIDSIKIKLSETKEDIISLSEKEKENTNTLEQYKEILEFLETYESVKEEYKKSQKDYDTIKSCTALIDMLTKELEGTKKDIKLLEDIITHREITISTYKSLQKQLKKYHHIYDDLKVLKEALSSKEGIPLYFINNYLGNVEVVTNELLDIVYNGRLYIDDFTITPTEFSIPFINNGVRLNDVKYASQGELSFLSLALSFALITQSINEYNIICADELDGALDMTNRRKFIEIVENQIDRVHSEQNFLITHNNMFSSYPVDILDLSYGSMDLDYPLANMIPIIRK